MKKKNIAKVRIISTFTPNFVYFFIEIDEIMKIWFGVRNHYNFMNLFIHLQPIQWKWLPHNCGIISNISINLELWDEKVSILVTLYFDIKTSFAPSFVFISVLILEMKSNMEELRFPCIKTSN